MILKNKNTNAKCNFSLKTIKLAELKSFVEIAKFPSVSGAVGWGLIPRMADSRVILPPSPYGFSAYGLGAFVFRGLSIRHN